MIGEWEIISTSGAESQRASVTPMNFKAGIILLFLTVLPVFAPGDSSSQWIVVSAPDFLDELVPLCEFRKAEGLVVIIIKTTDILSDEEIREGNAESLWNHLMRLCKQNTGKNYILLAGALNAVNADMIVKTVVPGLPGRTNRMKGQMTDHAYGNPGHDYAHRVAVGRFPAQSKDEMRAMVEKTLRYEREKTSGLWRNRLVTMIGNPGGRSLIEKRSAEFVIRLYEEKVFSDISPCWNINILSHSPLSSFFVPGEKLEHEFMGHIEMGGFFTIYLGHSDAEKLYSDGISFMQKHKWQSLAIQTGQGTLFTCGCHACQYQSKEGYGLTAMKNPSGPVAVIGAYGETYGVIGLLAVQGLLKYMNSTPGKARLADYWLAVTDGIAGMDMSNFMFALFDQADGSRGTVPLAMQRKEHLEMWTLFGDPGLNQWTIPQDIQLEVSDTITTGTPIRVRGILPARLAGGNVHMTLEWNGNSQPQTQTVISTGDRFETRFMAPVELPPARIRIRAYATRETEEGLGALALTVEPWGAPDQKNQTDQSDRSDPSDQ